MRLSRVARSLRVVLVPAIVAALVAFPLGVLANHSFSDVLNSNPFHADIAALKDSGVSTTGCGGGKFCPDDFVTRGQMAAFLNRLGALSPSKTPVANATTVDRFSANELIRVAYATDDNDALFGADGVALTASITAPVSGFLVISASSDVYDYTDVSGVFCWIAVDGVQDVPSNRQIQLDGTVNTEEDCSTDAVVPVAAGAHSVTLNGSSISPTGHFDESVLSVLFTPFGATGAQPVSIPTITKGPATNTPNHR